MSTVAEWCPLIQMDGADRAGVSWTRLVSALSQRPVVRVSRDGGRSYPARSQKPLDPTRPPSQPAAVPTWRQDGSTCLVALDLDTKRGDVASDRARLRAQFDQLRVKVIEDRSPSGGHHFYVLLAAPAAAPEVMATVRGIASQFPTVDVAPMVNLVAGCIRPPGSRHRSGGWQELVTPLNEAVAIAQAPNSATVWRGVVARFAGLAPAGPRTWRADVDEADTAQQLAPLAGFTAPSQRFQHIARTGDHAGYASPSEARQAVVWAAAASGWSLATLVRHVETGSWPGLSSLYSRYARPREALSRDWRKAIAFETARRSRQSVQQSNTREHKTQPGPTHTQGGERQHVRTWESAVALLTPARWATNPVAQLVLRALAQAAQRAGSTVVDVGVRSLAVATHLDPSTVSRQLAALEAEPTPVIHRLVEARGTRADSWQLVVPPEVEQAATTRPWRPGPTHALRPVFRVLGHVAGDVYERLAQAPAPLLTTEVAARSPWQRAAVIEALMCLASWGLAERTPAGWKLGTASCAQLAVLLGADLVHQLVVARFQEERRLWWVRLGVVREPGWRHQPTSHPPPADPHPVEDQVWAAACALLVDQLGAAIIPAE